MRSTRAAAGLALLGAMTVAAAASAIAQTTPAGTTTAAAPSPPPAVSVFPIPGSQVASPQAQISFRGVSPYALSAVKVRGSGSGSHGGRIAGHSDSGGASFIPDQPFNPGETVTVTTSMHLVGAPSGSYQFRVATSPGPIPYLPVQNVPRAPGDVLGFRSRPDLRPAAVQFLTGPNPARGSYLFLAPQFGPLRDGPMILDPQGHLVFFKPMPMGDVAADLLIQQYQGQPVLTWWQGYTNAGVGYGQDEIYDSSYREIAQVHAADGLSADLHEFLLTPAGTAWIVAYYPVYWDASRVGGSKHKIVLDSVVQEIDVATGLKLFQWDSLDHVPLRDSYSLPIRTAVYDYFHINSIDVDHDDNLILSGRNTWAAYKVDRSSTATMWTLGGKHSSFKMGPGASFAYQHDVRVRAPGDRRISLFDDADGPPPVHSQSRGLMLGLDFRHMTARLAGQRSHSPPLLTRFEGNLQFLPGGDSVIGWGQQPFFTEFDARGRAVLDARFVGTTSSYRVYSFPAWTGTPVESPAVATTRSGRSTTVYASWNGSTQTAWWRVFSGAKPGSLFLRRTVRKSGFETQIRIASERLVRVQAVDARGNVLASTAPVKTT